MCSLSSLGDDLLYHILRSVGPADAVRLAQTSPCWGRILTSSATGLRVWKPFAIRRWGTAVSLGDSSDEHESADNDQGGGNGLSSSIVKSDYETCTSHKHAVSAWYGYYRHRSSSFSGRPKQISHLDLIQEQYGTDPYKLLAACILCSRTSGGYIIRTVVHDFLQKYPTPTDVIEANITVMAEELHPLGLNRERTIKRFASGFVLPWREVKELHGCGAFAASSHDVFCKGDWKAVLSDKKADRNVKAYAAFFRRLLANKGDSDAESEEVREEEERAEAQRIKKRKQRRPPKVRKPLPERSKKKRNTAREGSRKSPRNR